MSVDTAMGEFDWDSFAELEKAYLQAREDNEQHFFYDGKYWNTDFAMWVLDYLKDVLKHE